MDRINLEWELEKHFDKMFAAYERELRHITDFDILFERAEELLLVKAFKEGEYKLSYISLTGKEDRKDE